ncbi:hypothetical protein [Adhaeribacter radiodurans]|uniref:Uncharacterized protein n=1 Tax=Adhaeribacter radiodurans TaxID=2745197 RepID=A0A7L7LD39_9BACT|nr:hypothetical protein [Adhaeribacter radiodurans]QMU30740.1 hypothetical protein HUW48_23125 [Adhaeribacter radiodurans]
MRWLLNIVFVVLLLITAAFTARYIKDEALPSGKEARWQVATTEVRTR